MDHSRRERDKSHLTHKVTLFQSTVYRNAQKLIFIRSPTRRSGVPQSYTSTIVGQTKLRPGEQSFTEGYYPSLGYDNESPECAEMLDRLAGECMMKAMLS